MTTTQCWLAFPVIFLTDFSPSSTPAAARLVYSEHYHSAVFAPSPPPSLVVNVSQRTAVSAAWRHLTSLGASVSQLTQTATVVFVRRQL